MTFFDCLWTIAICCNVSKNSCYTLMLFVRTGNKNISVQFLLNKYLNNMKVLDDDNLNKWLARHGMLTYGNYFVQQCRNMTDHAYYSKFTRDIRQVAVNMALNSTIPHPWCWFCHNFGRLNCFLFHIWQQRHGQSTANREPGHLPLYQRKSPRYCQTNATKITRQPHFHHVNHNAFHLGPYPTKDAGKRKTKIAYYEIEIRANARNVPANLNRFIPYRVPVDSDDESSESSACPPPTPDTDESTMEKAQWEGESSDKTLKKM